MIKFFCLLLAVAVAANAATFKNCDANAPVIINLDSIPDPLRLVSGGKLPIKGRLIVHKDFRATKLKVKVKIERKILWGYVKVPCISQIGSCTYNIDCSTVLKNCPTCQCPPPRGTHSLQETITLPSINVPSWLASGSYKVSFDARIGSDNSRVACGTLSIKLSS